MHNQLMKMWRRFRKKEDEKRHDFYISKVSRKAPWIYISYIAEVFYHLEDDIFLAAHQNRREAVRIVKVLNEMGYNVYIQKYDSERELPNIKNVKVVFGLPPNLNDAADKYKEAIVVLYNTGAFVSHHNSQIIRMTDIVNAKYGSTIPYRRLDNEYPELMSYKIADKILQIGSKFTIQTIPEEYWRKITLIHQSTQNVQNIDIKDAPENDFLFLGSTGNMLKGIPLLIDYFKTHLDKIIHIVAPIEDDYKRLIQKEITPNIVFHGFMDIRGNEFMNIVKKCNFIVYPSGTEGMPGSVLCAMKYGLIPIVTPWAAFDEIEEYGFLMNYNWNVQTIIEGINWALSIKPSERLRRKKKCKQYAEDYYNIERFTMEFRSFCDSFLPRVNYGASLK